jgi:hypothetical protein
MVRLLAIALGCVCVLGAASPVLRVDENATRVVLRDGRSAVSLAVDNSGASVPVRIDLAWLDSYGTVCSHIQRPVTLSPGRSRNLIAFPLPAGLYGLAVWGRLRYEVSPESAGPPIASGIMALSQIADHVFELRASGSFKVAAGDVYRMRVTALQPVTGRPVSGVDIEASLDLDDNKHPVEARTGRDGFATLDIPIPAKTEDDSADVEITASLGDVTVKASADLQIQRAGPILIETDKPLYQPGQMLRVRALCFTAAKRPDAGVALTLRITDEDSTVVFVDHPVTSKFGVAASEWQLPPNLRLGSYMIALARDDDTGNRALATVKVSRYDLPNFAVTVKPDRAYYLPGQDAALEVHADYLFGKPVPRGKVRVAHETERNWDYREQRWKIEEQSSWDAQVDAAGRAVIQIPLAAAHEELAGYEARRFHDLSFTAYVTDPISGRTEQRRFDLRVTKSPIHVYVISESRNGRQWISTSYADGRPASCRVSAPGMTPVTTNRYGVARAILPEADGDLEMTAHDGHGKHGVDPVSVSTPSPGDILIDTDKTIYRPGEPVRVTIKTDDPVPSAAFQVLRDGRLLHSEWLRIKGTHISFELPWRAEFSGEITLGIASGEKYNQFDSRIIIFPSNPDLTVTVAPARSSYRPGEEASVSFQTKLPDGSTAPSVLGISVVDSAVAERARSNAESPWGLWRWYRTGAMDLGGVSRDDLLRLDVGKPIDPELDLLAEVMLSGDYWSPNIIRSIDYNLELGSTYSSIFKTQFFPVADILDARYIRDGHHPTDLETLRTDLKGRSVSLDTLVDPWATPYRAEFHVEGASDVMSFVSAGPDKKFGTDDDITAHTFRRHYLTPVETAVYATLNKLPEWPETESRLRAVLLAAGMDLDALRDRWGTPYKCNFTIEGVHTFLRFESAGPDRKFGTKDDFTAGQVSGDYFSDRGKRLRELLASAVPFPANDDEWRRFLDANGLGSISDPWGHPLYATFGRSARYADVRNMTTVARYGERPETKTVVVPVTEWVWAIDVRSPGPDGKPGTPDDFTLATFQRVERVEAVPKDAALERAPPHTGSNSGTIRGTVVDVSGAVIPNTAVRAIPLKPETSRFYFYEFVTSENGLYELHGLPPGTYEVRVSVRGFRDYVMTSVPVRTGQTTIVDVTMQVGYTSETVEVTAAVPILQTEVASLASIVPGVAFVAAASTPRLREYFPETLLWQPSLETDARGRAHLNFKLADNITTWNLKVTASTIDGYLGTATTSIRAFQPFFVDHEPPRILTQDDEIELPVTVRNYLDRALDVSLSMQPEAWFQLLGPSTERKRIDSSESSNAIFPFRAIASVEDGGQKVTATSAGGADAIRKTVTVHPDGMEESRTVNALLAASDAFDFEIPADAIPGSPRAELKIYPNLISHLLDSAEGILRRPYGCGEQTISSTFPNVLLLRMFKAAGREDHPLRARALRYTREGVDRLLGYAAPGGGFRYWSHGDADVALSAYALTLLEAAAEFVPVDENLAKITRRWLLTKQDADGRWTLHNWDGTVNQPRTLLHTAYLAMTLARPEASADLSRSLAFLSGQAASFDEPYMLAAYALASRKSGQPAPVAEVRLRELSHKETSGTFWNLETNTPFYGWGLAGRLETTALAVRALSASGTDDDAALVKSGTLFLLRNKDRYGVWHSGQATVQVLGALIDVLSRTPASASPSEAAILVNGRNAGKLKLPGSAEIVGPIRLDVSQFVGVGANRVTLDGAPGSQAQVSARYYLPWPKSNPDDRSALRLQVNFDRTQVQLGDIVTCTVKVERAGFRGYGMLLAEIGLPPGADVDRASLDRAIEKAGYIVNHYDILPDRIVVYLWPKAGGTSFQFQFRPRFAMRAKTPGAVVYDYYNPEARSVSPSVKFVVGRVP